MKQVIREALRTANDRRFRSIMKQAALTARNEKRESKRKAQELKRARKNRARRIENGMLECLDCGPRPVGEFTTVTRAGKRYFDPRCDTCRKIRCIARNHNITPEKYRTLLAEAGGKCAVCGESQRLCLDHSHSTGQLRGMVCHRCNLAIAPFDSGNVDLAQRIADYLRRWAEVPMTQSEIREGAERERRMKQIRDRAKARKAA